MACKDVHVQDVVRRHNSNAANAKARVKFASRRTWCMGTGTANESLYRQIYENNLGNSEQQENGEHLEEEDDEQDDQYEDDVEQDICENYYVSNVSTQKESKMVPKNERLLEFYNLIKLYLR